MATEGRSSGPQSPGCTGEVRASGWSKRSSRAVNSCRELRRSTTQSPHPGARALKSCAKQSSDKVAAGIDRHGRPRTPREEMSSAQPPRRRWTSRATYPEQHLSNGRPLHMKRKCAFARPHPFQCGGGGGLGLARPPGRVKDASWVCAPRGLSRALFTAPVCDRRMASPCRAAHALPGMPLMHIIRHSCIGLLPDKTPKHLRWGAAEGNPRFHAHPDLSPPNGSGALHGQPVNFSRAPVAPSEPAMWLRWHKGAMGAMGGRRGRALPNEVHGIGTRMRTPLAQSLQEPDSQPCSGKNVRPTTHRGNELRVNSNSALGGRSGVF